MVVRRKECNEYIVGGDCEKKEQVPEWLFLSQSQ